MKIALDSNAYTEFAKGMPERLQAVQLAGEIYFPVIVLGELRAGFLQGKRRIENEDKLQRFLCSPRVGVLNVDDETTRHYAHLQNFIRKQGTPIPTNDIWIAAIVIQHGLVLCTADPHFRHIPHLPTC